MCLGQNSRLAESFQVGNARISLQQEGISRLYQMVSTCLYVLGVVLEVLEYNVIFYSSPVGDVPGRSVAGEVPTEVDTDVPVSNRRAVITRRLFPVADDGRRPVCSGVPVLERSRELLEQAFDTGMVVFRRVWF